MLDQWIKEIIIPMLKTKVLHNPLDRMTTLWAITSYGRMILESKPTVRTPDKLSSIGPTLPRDVYHLCTQTVNGKISW